jgi:hypothetical protein
MVKIEKPAALKQLDEILDLADSIMVARGDLGVELPLEEVPGWQKRLIRAARRAGKPVVVATQMLESMIEQPVPTRAEVSDVATAVFEGADAVMLSAESATGAWPDKAVMTMHRIAEAIEQDPLYRGVIDAQHTDPEATTPDAIANAARNIAETLQVAAIVCYTGSGSTGLRAARERPRCRWWRSRRRPTRAAAWRSSGACTACSPRMPGISTTWCSGPAGSRFRRVSPRSASASSSPPGCRWGLPARPTCCASRPSARIMSRDSACVRYGCPARRPGMTRRI